MSPLELLKKAVTEHRVILLPDGLEFACLSIIREPQDTVARGAVGRIRRSCKDRNGESETWTTLTRRDVFAFEGAKLSKRTIPEFVYDQEEIERYMQENVLEPVD